MVDFYQEALDLFDYTQALRRDFHMHPELGFEEVRTAGIVAKELTDLDLEVSTGIAKTGVIGILEGAKPGPVVLVRVDMDALPIEEENETAYVSQNPGVMHACGHDGHTAMGLTVAKILHKHRDELAGTVKLVFQPAEEGQGGAKTMVKEGVLDNPKPDYSLGIHLWNSEPIGWIGVTDGPAMAGSAEFTIKITGKGAHAAIPNEGIDPILAGAQIVTALQSVVSRNVNPLESVVVSVTRFDGGGAYNIIPPDTLLWGTIRYFKPENRTLAFQRVENIVKGVGHAMGCETSIEIKDYGPPVVNDSSVAGRIQDLAEDVLPREDQLVTDFQTMGAEDFSYLTTDIPSCFFFIGSANEAEGLNYGHHHPKFDFDEKAMPRGAALMAAAVVDLLSE